MFRRVRGTCGLAWLALTLATSCAATVVPYAGTPSGSPSPTYSLRVGGQAVFVQTYGTVSFARLAFSGPVDLVVTVSEPVRSYTLSPVSAGIVSSKQGQSISFSLDAPRAIVLRNVNALSEQLFILSDPLEIDPPEPGAAGVVDLASFGADPLGRTNSSRAIQRAIDSAANSGGGTVYVGTGFYRIEQGLFLKSAVTLYLAAGAVLEVPKDVRCCLANQAVISFSDLSGARLAGRGIINGNGSSNTSLSAGFHMVYTENIDDCEIDDVLLLDPGAVGIRLVDARDTSVHNIKILAVNPHRLSDGIDFDSCQHILVDGSFVFSSDDNTSQGGGTGLRGTIKDQYDLRIEHSTLYNARSGAAFKIGTTDPQRMISEIVYDDIDVIGCIQLAALYPTQGANLDEITLNDIRVESVADRALEFMIIIPNWEPWNGRLGIFTTSV